MLKGHVLDAHKAVCKRPVGTEPVIPPTSFTPLSSAEDRNIFNFSTK